MINLKIFNKLKNTFHFLDYLNERDKNIIIENANYYNFQKGHILMNAEEKFCDIFYMVLDGSIKVSKISEEGREVVLYRIGKGEICIVNVSCILSETVFSATATVECDSEIVAIPSYIVSNYLIQNPQFQKFLCSNILLKMEEIVMKFEDVTFKSVNERVLDFLKAEMIRQNSNVLNITHEELAYEIGSVREVASRSLKSLEKQGLLQIDRGKITIINL
ncbi:MAG: Crp/Fnr family transcriptional regulator [Tissierellia bacterium]|nr:Crp/Fnr family transcriptional regulator [Tissierellia bacterium]